MREKEHQDMGTTAASTILGVEGTMCYSISDQEDNNEDIPTKRCYFGNSWFANIGKAEHHAVFMVKTAHVRSPKK